MRIDIGNIDNHGFTVKTKYHEGLDEYLVLVTPNIDKVSWTAENLIFRSSVWDLYGNLVSAGFPKFFNWGECAEVSPPPTNLNLVRIVDKFDGSLLIVSKYKGEYILRVRGSIDTHSLNNHGDTDVFKERILPLLDNGEDTWDHTYLFEWLSSAHKIVISYKDTPSFKLIGKVNHLDYSLATQDWLDSFAKKHNIDRPNVYSFDSIDRLITTVASWEGSEGVIVYSNGDQTLHKVKSAWYLNLHRMKSNIASLSKVLIIWNTLNRPNFETFYNYIKDTFDYELAEFAKKDISKVVSASEHLNNLISDIKNFVTTLSDNRKESAQLIIEKYGNNGIIKSIAFDLYSGKDILEKQYLKAMEMLLDI